MRDSLQAARTWGRVCQAGFLGGLGPVQDFLPVFDMPSGVQFSFFGSFEVGTDAYPLSAIPFQEIVAKVEAGAYKARPARVFSFEDVAEAHRVMEASQAAGKDRRGWGVEASGRSRTRTTSRSPPISPHGATSSGRPGAATAPSPAAGVSATAPATQ